MACGFISRTGAMEECHGKTNFKSAKKTIPAFAMTTTTMTRWEIENLWNWKDFCTYLRGIETERNSKSHFQQLPKSVENSIKTKFPSSHTGSASQKGGRRGRKSRNLVQHDNVQPESFSPRPWPKGDRVLLLRGFEVAPPPVEKVLWRHKSQPRPASEILSRMDDKVRRTTRHQRARHT